MTKRDRIVLVALVAIAIVAGVYLKVVSPERTRASEVQSKVTTAEAALSRANAELAEAKQAEQRFSAAYTNLVSLGEAVPAAQEVSSLVYGIDRAAGKAKVKFLSVTASGAASTASTEPAATEATASAGAGFEQLPFTFTFTGSFFDLFHLMQKLQGFTVTTSSGEVEVSGRLLTINGLTLQAATSGVAGSTELTGTVTATAYVLPAGETTTAGATPSAPAGVDTSSGGATEASGAPAVVKVAP